MIRHPSRFVRVIADDANADPEETLRIIDSLARYARQQQTPLHNHLAIALGPLIVTQELLGSTSPLTEEHHHCIEALLDELSIQAEDRAYARAQLQRIAYHTYQHGCQGIRAFLHDNNLGEGTTPLQVLREDGAAGLDQLLRDIEAGTFL